VRGPRRQQGGERGKHQEATQQPHVTRLAPAPSLAALGTVSRCSRRRPGAGVHTGTLRLSDAWPNPTCVQHGPAMLGRLFRFDSVKADSSTLDAVSSASRPDRPPAISFEQASILWWIWHTHAARQEAGAKSAIHDDVATLA
jgi:hypothetical protein